MAFFARSLFLTALLVLLASCASSSILVGTARPPIDPATVKIYLKPPKKFEEVALLDSSSKSSWAISDQGKMDVVVRRLREEAAKHGANGVLLQSRGEQSAGTVGTASGSATAYGNSAYGSAMGVGANIFYKVGSGIAIYVIEE
jgi:hypothetical protein